MSAVTVSSAVSSAAKGLSAAAVSSAAATSPVPAPAPSPRRIAANRENAQKSTGPNTPEGKARSSQNASSHRIFSPFLLHQGENESYFISYRDNLIEDLSPQNFLELAAADRIVAFHWKLRRLQIAQDRLNFIQYQQFQKQQEKEQEILESKRDRHIANCQEMGLDCTEEDLANLGLSEPDPDAPPLIPDPGHFLAQSLIASQSAGSRFTVEERLLNMETKLHNLLSKAQKDYRQLQDDRRQKEQAEENEEDDGREPFCPFLTPPVTDDSNDDDNDPEDQDDIDEESEPTDNEQRTTDNLSATPDHTAPQCATSPTPSRQNEATCQNDTQSPPNSFGGSLKEQ